MGSLLISVPDIADSDLIYSEHETRQILKFFWPEESAFIDGASIDNPTRRLAQTALIAAIDGSYAQGFIDVLLRSLTHPAKGLGPLAKRLAQRYTRHWWQHAQREDLEDVRIYESVRNGIARALKSRLIGIKNGVAIKRGISPFHVQVQLVSNILWS